MAFPIGTHVVINGLSNAAEAAGTVVGYTTFDETVAGYEETTRPTRHHYIVELDDEYQVFLGDTNIFVKHIPVHEDYLRRSRSIPLGSPPEGSQERDQHMPFRERHT